MYVNRSVVSDSLQYHELGPARLLCPLDFPGKNTAILFSRAEILPLFLQWVAIPFSRGSSPPRGQTWVSHIAGSLFTIWATWEDNLFHSCHPIESHHNPSPTLGQRLLTGLPVSALILFQDYFNYNYLKIMNLTLADFKIISLLKQPTGFLLSLQGRPRSIRSCSYYASS